MFNQFQYQQKQQRFTEPPEIITNKDLLFLQDALSWELVASKKAHHYSMESEDQQIKQHLEYLANVHQRNYQALLDHVQPNRQQQNINEFSQIRN